MVGRSKCESLEIKWGSEEIGGSADVGVNVWK